VEMSEDGEEDGEEGSDDGSVEAAEEIGGYGDDDASASEEE